MQQVSTLSKWPFRCHSNAQAAGIASLVLFVIDLCLPIHSRGQPPPFVNSTGRDPQVLVHDGTSNPQVFNPQKWNIIAPQSVFGATVVWEATPFQHVDLPKYEADTLLQLSVRHSTQKSNWTAIQPQDGTNITAGRRTARVVAMSVSDGNAQVELTVTFREIPDSFAIVGDYEATVYATLTEH